MSALRSLARRMLSLPPRRCASRVSTLWLPMQDGTRLATALVQPEGEAFRAAPTLLLRTAEPAHAPRQPGLLWGRLLAESGYAVVVQECRGRYASEGRFQPFHDEAEDGLATLEWIVEQPWFAGRLGLLGLGYAAHAAFALLAKEPGRVDALVAGFGARDPHAWVYSGGAFALGTALGWGLALGEREGVPARELDLARGAAFRPVREADRVTLRSLDWFRDWVEHPTRDAYWRELEPPLPKPAPPTLLLTSWYDPWLGPVLDDYAALREATSGDGAAPELVVGPWCASRRRAPVPRGSGRFAVGLRETLAFFRRHLDGAAAETSPVRIFVGGIGRWRDLSAWPPPGTGEQILYLRGEGRLDPAEPPEGDPPDGFRYDPSDPAPTRGGCLANGNAGPADQRGVEDRPDVLCYTGAPLTTNLLVMGRVRATLFAESSAPDTDFTAKLVDVHPDGMAVNLCDGIARCRWRGGGEEPTWVSPDETLRVEIDLWATAHRLRAGHRIRLEVSSSNFPRFDRNPNGRVEPGLARAEDCEPAQQVLHHAAGRASHIALPVMSLPVVS